MPNKKGLGQKSNPFLFGIQIHRLYFCFVETKILESASDSLFVSIRITFTEAYLICSFRIPHPQAQLKHFHAQLTRCFILLCKSAFSDEQYQRNNYKQSHTVYAESFHISPQSRLFYHGSIKIVTCHFFCCNRICNC